MKILLITDHHGSAGGAEQYFFELKARLKKIPTLEIISLGFGPKTESGKDFYVFKAATKNISKLFWRFFLHRGLYRKLQRLIKEFAPDVIHLHNAKQYSRTLIKVIQDYPIVQTVHDFSYICPTAQNLHQDLQVCESGLSKKCFWQHRAKHSIFAYLLLVFAWQDLRLRLSRCVSAFITPSPLLATYLQKKALKNVHYIPPFVQLATATPQVRTPMHFLYAGNLNSQKGVPLLIEAFAHACTTLKDKRLQLTIAGTGKAEAQLLQRVADLGLSAQIHFVGWQSDLSSYYQTVTALIFPSIGMEAFGLVMTEAMSHACPIIAVNRGTAAWLVQDQQTGLLFDPLKQNDLAEKILTLAKQPQLAAQFGQAAQARVSELFDNEKSLKEILRLYKEVQCRVD